MSISKIHRKHYFQLYMEMSGLVYLYGSKFWKSDVIVASTDNLNTLHLAPESG